MLAAFMSGWLFLPFLLKGPDVAVPYAAILCLSAFHLRNMMFSLVVAGFVKEFDQVSNAWPLHAFLLLYLVFRADGPCSGCYGRRAFLGHHFG